MLVQSSAVDFIKGFQFVSILDICKQTFERVIPNNDSCRDELTFVFTGRRGLAEILC